MAEKRPMEVLKEEGRNKEEREDYYPKISKKIEMKGACIR